MQVRILPAPPTLLQHSTKHETEDMSNIRLACDSTRSFTDPQGRSYQPGQLISEKNLEEIGEERILQLMNKGRIVEVDLDVPDDEPEPKPKSIDEQRRDEGKVSPSAYDIDPADLEGLDLDDLNIMLLDIDDEAVAAKSIGAAVARLSADYKSGE